MDRRHLHTTIMAKMMMKGMAVTKITMTCRATAHQNPAPITANTVSLALANKQLKFYFGLKALKTFNGREGSPFFRLKCVSGNKYKEEPADRAYFSFSAVKSIPWPSVTKSNDSESNVWLLSEDDTEISSRAKSSIGGLYRIVHGESETHFRT